MHEYVVEGTQIQREVIYYSNSSTPRYDMRYFYDAEGNPTSFIRYSFNTSGTLTATEKFYYGTNLQGDIVAIYNASGTKIYTYEYDAWGNVIRSTSTGSAANTVGYYNPFRYRGYYYDTESGLYYLNSRYYNPQWGRFINADHADVIAATPEGLTDKNLFAYCDNNPITREDDDGEFWNVLIGAAVNAAFTLVTELIDNNGKMSEKSWAKVGIAAIEGGVTAAVGPVAGTLVSAGASVVSSLVEGETDALKIGKSAVESVALSAVSSGAEALGRCIDVRKLKKSSAANIKRVVTGMDSSISGSMRNKIKNPKNWSKELSKTVYDNIFSTRKSILVGNGIGLTLNTAHYIGVRN